VAGPVIFLIMQASIESICFELCRCILLFIFDHNYIRSLHFEYWLQFFLWGGGSHRARFVEYGGLRITFTQFMTGNFCT
jgi:hypothetical protein